MAESSKTGVVMEDLYIAHDPGPWHPESPERLRTIYSLIKQSGLMDLLRRVPSRPATRQEICRVHAEAYFDKVAATDGIATALDPDTHTSPQSFQAALHAAGGAIELVDRVISDELDNGFALVRPPGHHAEHSRAMGFCLFNNVAICAEHARQVRGLKRILIVDWDLHHGNGTMHAFSDRDDILYFSMHQYPYYPGTGALEDVGHGPGAGYTVNVPLSTGMGDAEYRAIIRDVLAPIAAQFQPELLLVSAGFDTLVGDPLGGMRMSARGYATLTRDLMALAHDSAEGRLVALLEGGYHIQGQAEAVVECLKVMLDQDSPSADNNSPGKAAGAIRAARNVQSRFWKLG